VIDGADVVVLHDLLRGQLLSGPAARRSGAGGGSGPGLRYSVVPSVPLFLLLRQPPAIFGEFEFGVFGKVQSTRTQYASTSSK